MGSRHCAKCGEDYSDTYKRCPFCEEEAALRSGHPLRRRGGKRLEGGRQSSGGAGGVMLLVAAVVILSVTSPESGGFDKGSLKKSLKGIAANPIIWGIFIGMILSVARIEMPLVINKTLHNFSVLATPLALIGLGAGFEGKKALAKMKPTIAGTLIKLFAMPAVFLPLAATMGFRNEKMVAILIMLGAPTTVSCYIMSRNMGHEGVLSSSCVVSTTFLSSVFITFWLYILKNYGLI